MKQSIPFSTDDPYRPIMLTIDIPDTCPLCGTVAYFERISSNAFFTPEDHRLCSWTLTLCCPKCHGIFHIDKSDNHDILICPSFGKCDLPEEIMNQYPDFASLYRQSLAAEGYGLTDISGMGFRKALEFLVKEYAIRRFPDEESQILSEKLGQTIARIPAPQIQALAKACAWIGNDQTHILVKHPDYGIPEMKNFILSLSHHILMEYHADKAIKFTNTNRKRS